MFLLTEVPLLLLLMLLIFSSSSSLLLLFTPYLFLFSTQVFTALFAAEIVFRLVAMGPMAFIRSRWNVFDTTVVSGSLLGYFYKSAEGLSIFRTLRLVRT